MDKIGYLDFSVVNPTLFTFVDEGGTEHRYEFEVQEPQDCIKTVATLIQQHGLTKVVCNKIGYGLCGSISQHLRTVYGNTNCFFELNE